MEETIDTIATIQEYISLCSKSRNKAIRSPLSPPPFPRKGHIIYRINLCYKQASFIFMYMYTSDSHFCCTCTNIFKLQHYQQMSILVRINRINTKCNKIHQFLVMATQYSEGWRNFYVLRNIILLCHRKRSRNRFWWKQKPFTVNCISSFSICPSTKITP